MNKFSAAAKSSGSLFKHTRLRQDFLERKYSWVQTEVW